MWLLNKPWSDLFFTSVTLTNDAVWCPKNTMWRQDVRSGRKDQWRQRKASWATWLFHKMVDFKFMFWFFSVSLPSMMIVILYVIFALLTLHFDRKWRNKDIQSSSWVWDGLLVKGTVSGYVTEMNDIAKYMMLYSACLRGNTFPLIISIYVSCQKGPNRHAYAWQIGPFWQDTLVLWWKSSYVRDL